MQRAWAHAKSLGFFTQLGSHAESSSGRQTSLPSSIFGGTESHLIHMRDNRKIAVGRITTFSAAVCQYKLFTQLGSTFPPNTKMPKFLEGVSSAAAPHLTSWSLLPGPCTSAALFRQLKHASARVLSQVLQNASMIQASVQHSLPGGGGWHVECT